MAKEVKTCLHEHSTLVKCAAIFLGLLIVALIGLFIVLLLQKDNHTCTSEACIRVSAEVIRYIDQSENPCDDFHEYICGKFTENQKEMPPLQPIQQLNIMIASPIVSTDSKIFQMEKLFYQSCRNLAAIDMNQENTILELFNRLGGWPVLLGPNWNESSYHWKDFMIQSKEMGLKFEWFLEFTLHEDVNNTRTNILKIDIPRYLKPVGSDQRYFRKELLTDIAVFLGAPKNLVHYETTKIIEFEESLANIAQKHKQRRYWNESSSTSLTIRQVQQLWPSIMWLELINRITKNRMTDMDYVAFDILDYIRDLNGVLYETRKRFQVGYMMWKMIEEDFWPYLSQPIRERFEKYNREVLKTKIQFDRERFCMHEAIKYFPLIAESMYIRQHVTVEKKHLVREMAGLIQRQFTRLVDGANWMSRDRNIRRNALRKIQEISFIVGGPDSMFNEEFGYTPGFEFQSLNVINMITERQNRAYDEYYILINQPITPNQLSHFKNVSISNYTMLNDRTLVIPAGVLQDSFYNPKLPNYLNYATVGKSLAGAVFNHLYIENDTYSWWALDAFDHVIKCLMKESANFPHSEFKRSRKLKENLSDFVAVDVAYEAYREWMRMQPPEMMMPGLKLSPNQLFWIQTSKTACSKIYSRHDRDNSRFKVIGPLRNSRYFAEEYNCPVGSRMNPARKCRVL